MRRKLKLFDMLVFAGSISLLSYFAWHGTEGPRSFDNHARLMARLDAKQTELELVRERRNALEARVKLMRPESVDPDMASELVRRMLGYGRDNSIVVNLD
jgi:cell division protein FtsB